ncbi:hypothetical protein [Campylobacter vulpis]|uniref:hypothetical protein n=1 Tax=Campylobacter vulpis TaxID=1655500 RepID=UPI0015DDA5FF|nr:hypothetical protein [Campylobacter vulpis]
MQDLENRFETLKYIRNLAQSYDEKQKTKKIFFNKILARNEVDILFARKALQNFVL